ncbi:MAG: hypothetical protein OXT65_01470 [Alphaproteobacteria bacterium]|nr:hypothetical protein [Alphaproteobacteria bacterium]
MTTPLDPAGDFTALFNHVRKRQQDSDGMSAQTMTPDLHCLYANGLNAVLDLRTKEVRFTEGSAKKLNALRMKSMQNAC